ncbi:hypothetical protein NHX12_017397 [Muraenolepis orangiensis]|uniref:Uncharacterized protein n=1 Tax=Muraenolepis orangiensis TaxID=630683 RepID=A0A9Q0D4R3_9TELE|nr:hypothetical protein NHX12_017397 [Muraenolepis orangiensis]
MTEAKYETDTKYEHPLAKEKKRAEQERLLRDEDPSQHKRAGLLMVHTSSERARRASSGGLLADDRGAKHASLKDHSQPQSAPPSSHPSHIHISPHKTFITVTSVEAEPVKLPLGMIPPPPLASVDLPEEEPFPESLPPPIEFANSFDISESQAHSIAELLKQTNNLSSDQALAITEILKQTQNATPISTYAARQSSSVSPFYPNYLLPTNSRHEIRCAPAGLTDATLPVFPEVSLDSFGPIGDSGIEVEVDGRSGGDPQLETTSTVSNVSSMSTLSSDGGGEGLDTCTVYADGQAFTAAAVINKSNRSAKVKTHNVVLHHRSGKEMGPDGMMAARDECSYNGGGPPSYVPPPPAPGEVPRTPRDGGEGKLPHMSKAGDTRRCAGPRYDA